MLFKITLILFTYYLTAIEGLYERPNYPDYKYRDQLTGWTLLHEEPATWDTATKICKDEDAVLISSTRDTDLTDILAEIVKESKKTIDKLHIGSRAQSLRDLKEYCLVINLKNATGNTYGDCNAKYPYVCYAPAPPVDCDTVEFGQDRIGWPGYNRCSKVKGWLKIHVGPADYETARAKCQAEGAQLVNPYLPAFKENAMKLFKANNTAEEPIFAVYSLAKVIHPHGVLEKVDGKKVWVTKNKQYCVIFLPNGSLGRTECEAKLSFICYARNPAAVDQFGPQLADTPELLTTPEGIELPYFNTKILSLQHTYLRKT